MAKRKRTIYTPEREKELREKYETAVGKTKMAKAKLCVPFEETYLSTWEERDRLHVDLRRKDNDETIFELWDDAVREAFEDGFLEGSLNERFPPYFNKLHESMYEYAEQTLAILEEGK